MNTVEDLAPIDAFHTRGRESTLEVAGLTSLQASDRVLDVGCGLGGTARHIADQYKCHVSGIDLTHEYIDVARQLTELVGLTDRVELRQGSALKIPYDDESFDVAWTEHVQMNIADKGRFYSEIARVSKSMTGLQRSWSRWNFSKRYRRRSRITSATSAKIAWRLHWGEPTRNISRQSC